MTYNVLSGRLASTLLLLNSLILGYIVLSVCHCMMDVQKLTYSITRRTNDVSVVIGQRVRWWITDDC